MEKYLVIFLLVGILGLGAIPVITHNRLDGLDGGTTDEYYHFTSSQYTTFTGSYSNWDTAYGWGDHASGGYLKADGSVALAGAWDMGSQNLTNVNIDSGTAEITSLIVDTTTLIVDDVNDRVGVGVAPAVRLDIKTVDSEETSITAANTNTAIRIFDPATAAGPRWGISWLGSLANQYLIAAIEPSVVSGWDTHLNFYTRQGGVLTNALHLDENGNVGIGTSSPDSAFHIKANVPGIIGSHHAGQLIIQNPADDVNAVAVITGYESDGSGNPDQQLWYLGSSSAGNEDIIFLNRRDAKLTLGTNGNYRLTILGNGNVGINVTDPDAKLEVVGTLHVSDAATFDGTLGAGAITGTSLTIPTTGEINFRDTDISIGSTLFDGILDMSADISIDMFYDNADVGAEVDGQSLNINRRAAEGDDWISLYVDKDRKGLIGFSGDDDLLQLAANALTVNGTITIGGYLSISEDTITCSDPENSFHLIHSAGGSIQFDSDVDGLAATFTGTVSSLDAILTGDGSESTTGEILLIQDGTSADPYTSVKIDNYCDNDGRGSLLYFRKSKSDTIGTRVSTGDGTDLASLFFQGVDDGNNWDWGGRMFAEQYGAVGVRVPIRYLFQTSTSTTAVITGIEIRPAGEIFMPQVYADTVNSNNLDLEMDDNGQIGTKASGRSSKENIRDLTGSERIYDLRPRLYNPNGSDVDEAGLVADEALLAMPEIVRFKRELKRTYLPTYDPNNPETATHFTEEKVITNEPYTVVKSDLIVPMLKEIQILKAEIDALKARVTELEKGS